MTVLGRVDARKGLREFFCDTEKFGMCSAPIKFAVVDVRLSVRAIALWRCVERAIEKFKASI